MAAATAGSFNVGKASSLSPSFPVIRRFETGVEPVSYVLKVGQPFGVINSLTTNLLALALA